MKLLEFLKKFLRGRATKTSEPITPPEPES